MFFPIYSGPVGYQFGGDLVSFRVSVLSLRIWVGYWYHQRRIRGHGSGSGMLLRCDAVLGIKLRMNISPTTTETSVTKINGTVDAVNDDEDVVREFKERRGS